MMVMNSVASPQVLTRVEVVFSASSVSASVSVFEDLVLQLSHEIGYPGCFENWHEECLTYYVDDQHNSKIWFRGLVQLHA